MNCCNWEWLKYSTVLLFPHDFTRVDHQEENSIILTLEIDTTSFPYVLQHIVLIYVTLDHKTSHKGKSSEI